MGIVMVQLNPNLTQYSLLISQSQKNHHFIMLGQIFFFFFNVNFSLD